MSTIKANAILDASGGNTVTINSVTPTAYNTMGKNRIINGDMRIWQRATSVTGSTGYSTVDRWDIPGSTSSLNVDQSSDVPAGFSYSTKITVGTASSASSAYAYILQHIEGYNWADVGYGTANAKTTTLSFWVKSSVTGTFGLAFRNTGTARFYTTTYEISSANTWEYKTITITGDTSGTWNTTNGVGFSVFWDLGIGSTYSSTSNNAWTTVGSNYFGVSGTTKLASTSGATFYITGVQLEAGSVATEFERRPYGTELSLCQRYYYRVESATNGNGQFFMGMNYDSSTFYGILPLPVPMRANPTLTTGGTFRVNWPGGGGTTTSSPTMNQVLPTSAWMQAGVSGGRVGVADLCSGNNDTSTYLGCSAEL